MYKSPEKPLFRRWSGGEGLCLHVIQRVVGVPANLPLWIKYARNSSKSDKWRIGKGPHIAAIGRASALRIIDSWGYDSSPWFGQKTERLSSSRDLSDSLSLTRTSVPSYGRDIFSRRHHNQCDTLTYDLRVILLNKTWNTARHHPLDGDFACRA